MGLLRGGMDFDRARLPLAFDSKTHKVEVEISSRHPFYCLGRLNAFDGEKFNSDIQVRVPMPCFLETKEAGLGWILPVGSFENVTRLPIELQWSARNFFGRLKWESPPERLKADRSLFGTMRSKVLSSFDTPYVELEAFRKAFFFGRTDLVSKERWNSLNGLGLSHAIVISGSHLAFLIFVFGIFFRSLLSLRPRGAEWFFRMSIIGSTSLYYLFCEGDSSLDRAFLGFAIIWGLGKIYPGLHRYKATEILSMVGSILTLLSPEVLFSPGFALSFGSTWALLQASDSKWLAPYVVTVPICFAFHLFVHPLSPLANLVFLPILFFWVVPLSSVSMVLPSLESLADYSVTLFFEGIEAVFRILEPITPASYIRAEWGFYLLILVVGIGSASFKLKYKWRTMAIGMFMIQIVGFFPIRARSSDRAVINVLDVGQGDGFLLDLKGFHLVIDGGGPGHGASQLLPEISSKLGNRVDLWVLTHFDKDHIGNFSEVFSKVHPREVWIPRRDHSDFVQTLVSPSVHSVASGRSEFCTPDYCIEGWMDPIRRTIVRSVKNQDSIAIIVSNRLSRRPVALFMGDLFAPQEKSLLTYLKSKYSGDIPPLPILKLGHHGSKTSSSTVFLAALHPKLAIISGGRMNSYRHPNEIVLERLESRETQISRTDLLGNFKVYFDF